jgi:hypothetical protein
MGNLLCKNQIHHDTDEFYALEQRNQQHSVQQNVQQEEPGYDYLNSHHIIYDKNTLCTICLDSECCVLLNCGHSNFCYQCIRELYYYNESRGISHHCPMCREKVRTIKVKYNMIYYI